MILRSFLAVLIAPLVGGELVAYAQERTSHSAEDWVYLKNDFIRLGVLRSSGGGIASLSPADHECNVLNHYDRGRLVQQSYYGDPDQSLWGRTPWCYNPVQGGEYRGRGATLQELRHTGTTLYTRTTPRHWAAGHELPECTMEEWVDLQESLAHVRFRFTYHGTASHQPHHQEIPAVFVDPAFTTLTTYEGDVPWTGAPLIQRQPGPKNEYHPIRENWVTYTGRDGWGVGVYVPEAKELTCYRFTGSNGSDCSYVAPITTLL